MSEANYMIKQHFPYADIPMTQDIKQKFQSVDKQGRVHDINIIYTYDDPEWDRCIAFVDGNWLGHLEILVPDRARVAELAEYLSNFLNNNIDKIVNHEITEK